MTDPIKPRRVIASTVGGALIGRFVADLVGAPPWVGGILGGGAPIARAVGSDQLPQLVAVPIKVLATPGEGFGRIMYPEGTTLLPAPASTDEE